MKGDLPDAALRLCSQLPVRTHTQLTEQYQRRLSSNNVRAVIVDGVLYESLTEASRQIGRCREAIRKRIYKGTARYA